MSTAFRDRIRGRKRTMRGVGRWLSRIALPGNVRFRLLVRDVIDMQASARMGGGLLSFSGVTYGV